MGHRDHLDETLLISAGKTGQTLNSIGPNRAGIGPDNGERGIGHEEGLTFELLQIFQHFQKHDVFCHENIVEELYIGLAAFNGNTVLSYMALFYQKRKTAYVI